MPETYTQVRAFCGLAGHYRLLHQRFHALLACPLYDILGNKVKMGPVTLPPEAQKLYDYWRERFNLCQYLCSPTLNKPFLLETDASKEGLGVVLSQKQDDGCYHPVAFGSWTLMPSKQNYHSSKLEFLALKWSITEHFKEYLAYAPFTVRMDNNPLTYMLTTPNLDVMGHCWVGALASYEFTLEYQKGTDNATADALSRVPINHDKDTVWSLLEGAVTGTTERGEALASHALWVEHDRLSEEMQATPSGWHPCTWPTGQRCRVRMHCWPLAGNGYAQERMLLCKKGMHCLEDAWASTQTPKEGWAMFHIRNSYTMKNGVVYVNTMPKGETEGLLAFVVPSAHRRAALNGMHQDAGHQGQQRMLVLAQECFWWPKMEDDWQSIGTEDVNGTARFLKVHCSEGPLCPIQAYAPLELVHVDFTSIETTMELNQPLSVKNILVLTDHFTRYMMAFMSPRTRRLRLSHIFSMSDSSQYLTHQQSCSVTVV